METRNGMPIVGNKATDFDAVATTPSRWIIAISNPANTNESLVINTQNTDFEGLNCRFVKSPTACDIANTREICFVDPRGIVRTVIYSSLLCNVDMEEIKRTLIGLQAVDAYGLGLPTDWYPGEEVIIHKESTCPIAENSLLS